MKSVLTRGARGVRIDNALEKRLTSLLIVLEVHRSSGSERRYCVLCAELLFFFFFSFFLFFFFSSLFLCSRD